MAALGLMILTACDAPRPPGEASADAACTPISGQEAATWLTRARTAVGIERYSGSVLHLSGDLIGALSEQSDRPYSPFILSNAPTERWLSLATGEERSGQRTATRGIATSATTAYAVRDGTAGTSTMTHIFSFPTRALNPWTVLLDWSADPSVRVGERCVYRGYPRVVLTRDAGGREARLFLDEKTAFPVKLDRFEPNYLWGDAHVEYVYATWWRIGPGAYLPVSSTELLEGELASSLSVFPGGAALVPADSAPTFPDLPVADAPPNVALRNYAGSMEVPDTVRVADDIFLLRAPFYTETVALVGDTVYLFDATTGEQRAQQDSIWIGKLFPGAHPVAVVVTDLAWPHIAGMRFWVASGATIVSHANSRTFLQRVVDHTWRVPDRLEERRGSVTFRFRPIEAKADFAGGALSITPIDGVASEGALIAFLPGSRYLWASDFIQGTDPSLYMSDVYAAVGRAGWTPQRVAAEHLGLTAWSVIENVIEEGNGGGR